VWETTQPTGPIAQQVPQAPQVTTPESVPTAPQPPSLSTENASTLRQKKGSTKNFLASFNDEMNRCSAVGAKATTLHKYLNRYVRIRIKQLFSTGGGTEDDDDELFICGENDYRKGSLVSFLDLDGSAPSSDVLPAMCVPLSQFSDRFGIDRGKLIELQEDHMMKLILRIFKHFGKQQAAAKATAMTDLKGELTDTLLLPSGGFEELLDWAWAQKASPTNSPLVIETLVRTKLILDGQGIPTDVGMTLGSEKAKAAQFFLTPVQSPIKGAVMSRADTFRQWFHRMVVKDAESKDWPFSLLVKTFEISYLRMKTSINADDKLKQKHALFISLKQFYNEADRLKPVDMASLKQFYNDIGEASANGVPSDSEAMRIAQATLDEQRAQWMKALHDAVFKQGDVKQASDMIASMCPIYDSQIAAAITKAVGAFELIRECRQFKSETDSCKRACDAYVLCERLPILICPIPFMPFSKL
jgi:hypothetical protein